MGMTALGLRITEQQLINYYISNGELNDDIIFNSKVGRDIHTALIDCEENNLSYSHENILKRCTNKDITFSLLQSIQNVEYKKEEVLIYEKDLKTQHHIRQINDVSIKALAKATARKSDLDLDEIRGLASSIDDHLSSIEDEEGEESGESFIEALEKYKQNLGVDDKEIFSPSGDYWLDKQMSVGYLEGLYTIICAESGVGKTKIAINQIARRIIRRFPTVMFTLELPKVSIMHQLISVLEDMNAYKLLRSEEGKEQLTENVDFLIKRFEKDCNTYIDDSRSLSFPQMSRKLRKIRRKMGLTKKDPLVVYIDLLTMISEFDDVKGDSLSTAYTLAVNKLHQFCGKENVHVVGIVQLKEDRDKVKIESYDDIIEKCRPTKERIKNSGALFERARQVFIAFRPKYIALQKLGENDPSTMIEDDILYLHCVKQNEGKVGWEIPYLFEGEKSKLTYIANGED